MYPAKLAEGWKLKRVYYNNIIPSNPDNDNIIKKLIERDVLLSKKRFMLRVTTMPLGDY